MLIDWKMYFRLWKCSIFRRKELSPSKRRSLAFCLTFLIGYPLTQCFHGTCWLLDEVLFSRYRQVRVRAPIFIIGNTRSGTTILHRVLALESGQFFFFRAWELLFPSLLQRKALDLLGKLDGWLGCPGRSLLQRVEERRFREYNDLHKIGLFLPEEDDHVFGQILDSALLSFLFPNANCQAFARLDTEVAPEDRKRIMTFYSKFVRRQAYLRGADKTLLSKNPFFTGKIQTLLEWFPDARFIYLVRNPLDVVPSNTSMARAMIRLPFGIEPETDLDEEVYDLIKFYYTYPLDILASLPSDRSLIVNYDDLVSRPKEQFLRIYSTFGLRMSPEYSVLLEKECAAMLKHKSAHRYSLDHCSISRDRIVTDLRHVFERFGFDTRPTWPTAETPAPVGSAAGSSHDQVPGA